MQDAGSGKMTNTYLHDIILWPSSNREIRSDVVMRAVYDVFCGWCRIEALQQASQQLDAMKKNAWGKTAESWWEIECLSLVTGGERGSLLNEMGCTDCRHS